VTVIESLLWPLSIAYGGAARLRAHAYQAGIFRQRRLTGLVVSVGNLTAGGTGKTPMVLWLAQRFAQSGNRVGILARGYRPLTHGAAASGAVATAGWNDEVAMLHGRLGARAELGIGARRFERGSELEERGVDAFILDDGFQHLPLARDVDIVMIDAMNPFGGGHVLPSGRLREPVSAVRRADIVVIHRAAERMPAIEAVIRRYSRALIYLSQTKLLGLEEYRGTVAADVSAGNRKFLAFCGIGNPPAFFADLKNWGIAVTGYESFRDHHRYSQSDLERLEDRAHAAGADALVCTEKDMYDLPPNVVTPMPVFFCKIGLQFNDQEGLWRSILTVSESKKLGKIA
jgi:tetraacyldisaccharide 4'-kinase